LSFFCFTVTGRNVIFVFMKKAGNHLIRYSLTHLLTLGIALVVTAGPVFSGDSFFSRHPHGVRGGLNLASMYGTARDSVSTKPAIAPTVGAFIVFPIHEQLEIQTELLLTVKGVKQDFTSAFFGGTVTFSETGYLLYAELPVLAKFPFPTEGARRTSVFAGPFGAINLWSRTSGDYDITGSPTLADGSFSGNIGNVHRIDFGLIAGIDHRFNWGNKTCVLDLRYTQGLREVFSDIEDRETVPDDEIPYVYAYSDRAKQFKNATLTLSLSLMLTP